MKENQLTIVAEDGTEELCEILFTHFDQENNKNYVVFQVLSSGECSAMEFIEENEDGGQLMPIETDEEWDMIEELLEQFEESLDQDCGCGHEECGCGDDCECNEENNCGCGCK